MSPKSRMPAMLPSHAPARCSRSDRCGPPRAAAGEAVRRRASRTDRRRRSTQRAQRGIGDEPRRPRRSRRRRAPGPSRTHGASPDDRTRRARRRAPRPRRRDPVSPDGSARPAARHPGQSAQGDAGGRLRRCHECGTTRTERVRADMPARRSAPRAAAVVGRWRSSARSVTSAVSATVLIAFAGSAPTCQPKTRACDGSRRQRGAAGHPPIDYRRCVGASVSGQPNRCARRRRVLARPGDMSESRCCSGGHDAVCAGTRHVRP